MDSYELIEYLKVRRQEDFDVVSKIYGIKFAVQYVNITYGPILGFVFI